MPYLYLVSAVVLMTILNLFGAGFNKKHEGEANVRPLYNMMLCIACSVTWGIIFLDVWRMLCRHHRQPD